VLSLHILSIGGLVPWHPEAGGGQIIAYKTSEALARAGHKVHYLAVGAKGYERQVDWGDVGFTSSAPALRKAIPLARRLARSPSAHDYDVVHVHVGTDTMGYALAYAVARRMGLQDRLVMSIYAPRTYAVPRSLGEVITALSCHGADVVFSLSEFSRRDLARAYRLPLSRIVVTYAGVDPSFTTQPAERARNEDDPFTLLFCGRLNGPHQQKGLDVLLKSLPTVLRRHRVVLKVIGTGPRLNQYQRLARDLGVAEQVRFLGFVEHQDMPRHYQQADLFVLPSRRESFGLVLAEAMACGLPVVATRAGAIPEVVEDGTTGALVPPDDPAALASAVLSLLSDRERMKALGAAGAARVARLFTWDMVATRIVKGYAGAS
jgi:glycosyltransferase involved in cell wall biosynthesis